MWMAPELFLAAALAAAGALWLASERFKRERRKLRAAYTPVIPDYPRHAPVVPDDTLQRDLKTVLNAYEDDPSDATHDAVVDWITSAMRRTGEHNAALVEHASNRYHFAILAELAEYVPFQLNVYKSERDEWRLSAEALPRRGANRDDEKWEVRAAGASIGEAACKLYWLLPLEARPVLSWHGAHPSALSTPEVEAREDDD